MTLRSTFAARAFATALCAAPVALGPAFVVAPAQAAAPLSSEDKARVDAAAGYLQNLASVSGRFTQTSPTGQTSTGQLYLQRPGKARFAYDPPARMTIVSDGKRVGLWDGKLDTYETAPLNRTPLNLLLAKHVRLDQGVVIARVDATSEGFALTALDAAHQAQGRIVIYFQQNQGGALALRGWNLSDAQGRTTQVRLGDLTAKGALDPALFALSDPRKSGG